MLIQFVRGYSYEKEWAAKVIEMLTKSASRRHSRVAAFARSGRPTQRCAVHGARSIVFAHVSSLIAFAALSLLARSRCAQRSTGATNFKSTRFGAPCALHDNVAEKILTSVCMCVAALRCWSFVARVRERSDRKLDKRDEFKKTWTTIVSGRDKVGRFIQVDRLGACCNCAVYWVSRISLIYNILFFLKKIKKLVACVEN